MEWQPIETAPKDGTLIVGWCEHDADPYVQDEKSGRLTTYAAHAEGFGHVSDGPHVLSWGGEYQEDVSGEGWGPFVYIPSWWFRNDTDEVANPTHWMPIPQPPKVDA